VFLGPGTKCGRANPGTQYLELDSLSFHRYILAPSREMPSHFCPASVDETVCTRPLLAQSFIISDTAVKRAAAATIRLDNSREPGLYYIQHLWEVQQPRTQHAHFTGYTCIKRRTNRRLGWAGTSRSDLLGIDGVCTNSPHVANASATCEPELLLFGLLLVCHGL
jgi:hypothetical protein